MDNYKTLYKNLTPCEIALATCKIQESEKFELDDLSHIVLKETNKRVGYIGDETLELCNSSNSFSKKSHQELRGIFDYSINLANFVSLN